MLLVYGFCEKVRWLPKPSHCVTLSVPGLLNNPVLYLKLNSFKAKLVVWPIL